jgi:hypothetical protein
VRRVRHRGRASRRPVGRPAGPHAGAPPPAAACAPTRGTAGAIVCGLYPNCPDAPHAYRCHSKQPRVVWAATQRAALVSRRDPRASRGDAGGWSSMARLLCVLCVTLCACASLPRRELPRSHPAHPEAHESTPAPPSTALAAEGSLIDPAGEPGDAHRHGTPAPAASEATVYTCPMHPEVVQSEPGTCPKCGMKLTPRPSGAGAKTPPEREAQQDEPRAPQHGGDAHQHDGDRSHGAPR